MKLTSEASMTNASSTYGVRVIAATDRVEQATAWANTVNALLGPLGALEAGGTPIEPWPVFPRDIVGIVHLASGQTVVEWRLRRSDAKGLTALIVKDLNSLDAPDFEAEWNVAPPAEPYEAEAETP
jgi:hypothetical protein